MENILGKSASKVQTALNQYGLDLKILTMQDSTRTCAEAAQTIGCQVGQIVKSMIFRGKTSGTPLLIIASGTNRINEKKMKEYLGEAVTRPDANYVQETTGFAIGGIPPLGHSTKLKCFIDSDLFQYDEVWAAAGTPFTVFRLTPDQLLTITQGQVIQVK
ncbi:YbaK/EbsC family protein [Sporomusa acidovorans]|uniref:YbaK/aminoacyl-tRNA synthetase-associated domain-containing protein n=1 Tax=Sporomusa acidovorans (strain ATCC 49682 / DSM 3132 / Mol) TaxID=1123286 RepID=A0ABZ3IW64_SPOA4|nr:YbaK/EbsC family protein [Sporomusa acidovorans]OZC22639.1 Cys-tRNA(Pro)/Cys-tRNA(Cys) deacylase YbaK [Sporomusa acidovorans DSM 3132]SDE76704.1 Cys-tRNA(Pro) deacylase, prolyl-tRNA editing enzyme YbaK/EbsC [Sporomusa acidovorans]